MCSYHVSSVSQYAARDVDFDLDQSGLYKTKSVMVKTGSSPEFRRTTKHTLGLQDAYLVIRVESFSVCHQEKSVGVTSHQESPSLDSSHFLPAWPLRPVFVCCPRTLKANSFLSHHQQRAIELVFVTYPIGD